jgi:putative transposase
VSRATVGGGCLLPWPAGAVSKDTVSRVWRKVKADWDARNARSLAEEPIVRLILDGTVVRVRLDRKATSIVLLVGGPASL